MAAVLVEVGIPLGECQEWLIMENGKNIGKPVFAGFLLLRKNFLYKRRLAKVWPKIIKGHESLYQSEWLIMLRKNYYIKSEWLIMGKANG